MLGRPFQLLLITGAGVAFSDAIFTFRPRLIALELSLESVPFFSKDIKTQSNQDDDGGVACLFNFTFLAAWQPKVNGVPETEACPQPYHFSISASVACSGGRDLGFLSKIRPLKIAQELRGVATTCATASAIVIKPILGFPTLRYVRSGPVR